MRLQQCREHIRQALKDVYSETYSYDICFIIRYCLGINSCWDFDVEVDDAVITRVVKDIYRSYPLQYICGVEEFLGESFLVFPGVFIPREETEDLVNLSLSIVLDSSNVLEIGVGTGVIGISLLLRRKDIKQVIGVDINPIAIVNSHVNARQKGVIDRLYLFHDDIFLFDISPWDFDFIISNPPYLPLTDKLTVPKNVVYEPENALYGGSSGVEFIIGVIDKLMFKKGLKFLFEFDPSTRYLLDEHIALAELNVQYYRDRFGKERFALIWRS